MTESQHTLLTAALNDGIEEIVVGAVLADAAGRVLLLHRPDIARDGFAGLWELPSGTREPGEMVFETLVRGVEEATGLTVTVVGGYLGQFDYRSGSGKATRQVTFAVTTDGDSVQLSEHDDYQWAAHDRWDSVSPEVQQILQDWSAAHLGNRG
ncbi:NUDIX domain-containing protein [Saccharopolyspora cebuensis]|uniref:8-oxo-dGTP diphosphatase n=1 Tax=Saccharopolyspora cebuensis TaxID=418759 RepID=A0ABV4CQM2_9PSEU